MTILERQTIFRLIKEYKLVTGMIDKRTQVSPNGVELSLHKIFGFKEAGIIDFTNKKRYIPRYEEIQLTGDCYVLAPGTYLVTYNETVRIPLDMVAIGRPRSSLIRSGVTVESAVWDAGYEGRSRGMLTVFNPHGFRVMPNARLLHLVFVRLDNETESYQGSYQGET